MARKPKRTPQRGSRQRGIIDPAIVAFRRGDFTQAETLARQTLKKQPQHPKALDVLGSVLLKRNQVSAAVTTLEQAAAADSNDADIWEHLGSAYLRANRPQPAVEAFQRALALEPDRLATLKRAGEQLVDSRLYAEAEPLLRHALEHEPDDYDVLIHLGVALFNQEQYTEAERLLRRATRRQPDQAKAWIALGMLAEKQTQLQQAMAHFDQALEREPRSVLAWCSKGYVCITASFTQEAVRCFQQALRHQPNTPAALSGLGKAYRNQGYPEKAIEYYRQALVQQPHNADTRTELLLCLNYVAELPLETVWAEHQAYQEQHAAAITPLPEPLDHDRDPDRRLRLGIISGDLRNHSVVYFLRPLLEHLPQDQFAIYCYHNNNKVDKVTEALQALASGWTQCEHLSHAALAAAVRADAIDILLDLGGHTGSGKMLTFAARPAPIQLSWIGYPNTSGLTAMDYRLIDAVTDPPGAVERYHSETLLRLPHGFLCYRAPVPPEEVPVADLPYQRNGYITFGSFNNLAKVSAATLDLWARALNAVPHSWLVVKSLFVADAEVWDEVIAALNQRGVDVNRVKVLQRTVAQKYHLKLYDQIDIALDTYPYHGTTTSCEALYMGVPVITLAGDRHAARVSASLLTQLGLQALIATSPEDYARIAADLAQHPQHLAQLRRELRQRMAHSPLGDEIGFTHTVAGAFRQMWQRWCRSEPAAEFPIASHHRYLPPPPWRWDGPLEPQVSVTIAAGVQVSVVPDIQRLTPFVLLEQEDGYHEELAWVRRWVQPGMTAVDVGAGYGVYALTIARLLNGQGRVVALEPASAPAASLALSVRANHVEAVTTVLRLGLAAHSGEAPLFLDHYGEQHRLDGSGRSETIRLTRLDDLHHEVTELAQQRVDLLNIMVNGAEQAVLEGGSAFLRQHDPLILCTVKPGDTVNQEVIATLIAPGRSLYRLLPGLEVLVPVAADDPLEGYQLNLFAASPERAAQLAERGLLLTAWPAALSTPPPSHWPQRLAAYPYAQPLLADWQAAEPDNAGRQHQQALDAWFCGDDPQRPPAERLSALLLACELWLDLRNSGDEHIATQIGLLRTFRALGERTMAVNEALGLVQTLSEAPNTPLDRPFIPPLADYADRPVEGDLGVWLQAAALEALEYGQDFSAYFHNDLGLLKTLFSNPHRSLAMERRLALLALRQGRTISIGPNSRLRAADQPNAALWAEITDWPPLEPVYSDPAPLPPVNPAPRPELESSPAPPASPPPPVSSSYALALPGGLHLYAPDTLAHSVTYRLLEQADAGEPELSFMSRYVQPGMTVLDTATELGLYALCLAQRLHGHGQLIALAAEPLFATSVHNNQLDAVITTERPQPLPPCDAIRFTDPIGVNHGVEWAELSAGEPLIVFDRHPEFMAQLHDHGWSLYRLAPGLGALIPYNPADPHPPSRVFACTATRAGLLRQRELLVGD